MNPEHSAQSKQSEQPDPTPTPVPAPSVVPDPESATGAAENHEFPTHVVGVGASAGGLEALEQFFSHMSPNSGLAFVVIQHLSPDFKSVMDELLARRTQLRVCRTEDGARVERDSIYLIPPRKNLTIKDGCLHLVDQPKSQGLNLPIDLFFNSLAQDQGERAIAIVLSGTGSDGTRGIRSVKEAGGMVIVQDQASAKFDGMPHSAIQTGLADFILAAEEMPAQLLRVIHHPCATAEADSSRLAVESTKLDAIVQILERNHRIDFSFYKPSTFSRRVERRMSIAHMEDVDSYIALLKESTAETRALVNDLLIGVTRFFRDPDAWERLRKEVLPRLLRESEERETFRCWVTGCSTGEEAYSLAMLIQDTLRDLDIHRDFKIFATDVDEAAIDTASLGLYPESIVADMSAERLRRYFTRRDGGYQIVRLTREHVIFATHNVICDPPFTKIDFVSCRNLLIYLRTPAQRRILALLHFALRPWGVLFLGSSESLGDATDAFRALHDRSKLFQKNPNVTLAPPQESSQDIAAQLRAPLSAVVPRTRATQATPTAMSSAYQALADAFMPAGLLLSKDHEVLHTFGDMSAFLQIPSGTFSYQATKIVVSDLRVALATALHRALNSGEPVQYQDIRVRTAANVRTIDLNVRPIRAPHTEELYFYTWFEERRPPAPPEEKGPSTFDVQDQKDARILDLEQELQQTKENLQATIEEVETSNEELQSTNEELVASNEELQSTNEELHSVNEELYTINSEYQAKIDELVQLTNDFDNLLRSTDIGTIFLDRNLKVRKFTPAACEFVNLMEADIGRPIGHLTHRLGQHDLSEMAQGVIETGKSVHCEVQCSDGRWVLLRALPFLTQNDTIDGVVIPLVDVSPIKQTEAALRDAERVAEVAESINQALLLHDSSDLSLIYVNPAYERIWGRSSSALHQKPDDWIAAVHADDRERVRKAFHDGTAVFDEEFRIVHDSGDVRWITARCFPVRNELGELYRIATVMTDVTARKQAEDTLRSVEQRFRNIFENAPIGKALLHPDGHFLDINPAFAGLVGYSADDAQRTRLSDLVHTEDRAALEQLLATATKSPEQAFTIEKRLVHRDGTQRWAMISITAEMRDEQIDYFIVQIIDTTTRKDTELALRHTEARFRAAIEAGLDNFYLLKSVRQDSAGIVDFEVIDLNSRGAELLTRARDEVVGRRLTELIPTAEQRGWLDRFRQVVETGQPLEEDIEIDDPHIGCHRLHQQVVPVGDGIAIVSRRLD